MDEFKRSRYLFAFALILLVVSVVINVALAQELKGANEKLAKIGAETNLSLGSLVPSIEAANLDGIPTSFSYSTVKRPTVVYIFSPSCRWCEKNGENIQELVKKKGNDFQFVGLSVTKEGVAEYINKQNLRFPILVDPSTATISAYKLGGTPQTLVVSDEGKVLKNWSGAYSDKLQTEVENYFQIKLPGIPK